MPVSDTTILYTEYICTIVQSYITSLLPWYCYECEARVTNAKGDKRAIYFQYSFVAMVILILSYKRVILFHVPLPMNVANARYHSLLGDAISLIFWFQLFALVEKPWVRGLAFGRSHTIRATRVQQLYSRVQSRRDARLYGRVQLRLSELPTSKPALFMNAKLVSSSSSRPRISCLLAVAHVSYST